MNVLLTGDARKVLDFLREGASTFEASETPKHENFYTLSYQRTLLNYECKLLKDRVGVRYWLSLKDNPSKIIGTVSFSYCRKDPFYSCQIGYKLLPEYWHQGLATEAISSLMPEVCNYLHVHRVQALVLPSNESSIRLLERLDFHKEGLMKESFLINNKWEDHLLYTYINQNFEL